MALARLGFWIIGSYFWGMPLLKESQDQGGNPGLSILYFARINKEGAPGIYKKLSQTVETLQKLGYKSELILTSGEGGIRKALPSVLNLMLRLLSAKADIVIVRNDILMPLLFIGMIIQRLRGAYVIVDVPTPIFNWIKEIDLSEFKSKIWRLRRTLLIRCVFPWSLWPACKIIQYASESIYFSFGIKKKTIVIGNGIDVDLIPIRALYQPCIKKEFVMIGVAALAEWHGYDRIIRGIAEYNLSRTPESPNVIFSIIGDGPIRKTLTSLSQSLGVGAFIRFYGFLSGEVLDSLFNNSHVAISSLGLYRVGLSEGSSLKSREYTARGVPFVNSGRDIDFEPTPFFVFQVTNDNEPIDIFGLINWYENLEYDAEMRNNLRSFAYKKLSFLSKIEEMISRSNYS